jgi:hypothetical protein
MERLSKEAIVSDEYVLIQTQRDRRAEALRAVSTIDHVAAVELVTGPYDIVVRVRGNGSDPDDVVLKRIQRSPGVLRALACPVIA